MDARTNDRPMAHWVEVPTAGGGTRLEMRWDTGDAPVGTVTHAA